MRLGLSMRLRATAPTAGGAGDVACGRAAAGGGAPCIGSSGGTWVRGRYPGRAGAVLRRQLGRACTEGVSDRYLRCTCEGGRLQLRVREARELGTEAEQHEQQRDLAGGHGRRGVLRVRQAAGRRAGERPHERPPAHRDPRPLGWRSSTAVAPAPVSLAAARRGHRAALRGPSGARLCFGALRA